MTTYQNQKPQISPQCSFTSIPIGIHDQPNKIYSKKKIGEYAYYLTDLIGSGFSSEVYKCHHRQHRHKLYAIKVIKLSKISKGSYQLLQNQIKILQGLDHPNIIKFHNVYYTQNNCYIITDYCEGGTLQEWIDENKLIDWENVIKQLIAGCTYLAENLIIHRDIKPANIFLQNGEWKIGDFGFARYIFAKEALVKQIYKVGSPLFMPPQTLSNNIYSLKTDSFALGILFFYMITKHYPWPGTNRKQLIEFYQKLPLPLDLLKHIPIHIQQIIISLLKINVYERALISDLNDTLLQEQDNFCAVSSLTISTNLPQRSESSIQSQEDNSQDLKITFQHITELDIMQRLKLCKFIHYIIKNTEVIVQFSYLNDRLKRLLKLYIVIFDWMGKDGFKKYVQEFNCQNSEPLDKLYNFRLLQQNIQQQIKSLTQHEDKLLQSLRIKLIQLKYTLNLIVKNQIKVAKEFMSKLILHPDFMKIYISPYQKQEVQKLLL